MTHNDDIRFPGGPLGAHGECWNLLPWIANESAATKDVARVEAHLRDCRECQEELDFQRQLRNAIRSEEAVVLAPQTSLHKLMQRIDTVEDIDAEPEAAPAQTILRPLHKPMRWSRWLPIAAAVQAIAIAGLLATVWVQSADTLTAPRYTMLLTPEKPVAHGQVIRVVFAGDVALDDMNRVLRSIDAQVISGPSKSDVYTLGLPARTNDQAKVEQALAQLRADSHVRFAELVTTSEAP
jgi:hypothetical protein